MYRLTMMGGTWYASKFDDLEDELPNFEGLLENEGNVLIVNDLDDLKGILGIDVDEIVVVE